MEATGEVRGKRETPPRFAGVACRVVAEGLTQACWSGREGGAGQGQAGRGGMEAYIS